MIANFIFTVLGFALGIVFASHRTAGLLNKVTKVSRDERDMFFRMAFWLLTHSKEGKATIPQKMLNDLLPNNYKISCEIHPPYIFVSAKVEEE